MPTEMRSSWGFNNTVWRGRLDSWKEIAGYLRKGERTVKRWARERALPVHHVPGGGHSSVYAWTAELDAWLVPGEHGIAGVEGATKIDGRGSMEEPMLFLESKYPIDVWIDMPIAEAGCIFAPMRVAAEEQEGGTRLRCGWDHLEIFAAMLLSMGRRVVVHRPAEMRKTFRRLARRAMEAANVRSRPKGG